MLNRNELRRVEVFNDGKWKRIVSIGQIEKGDIFRAFEPDGEPVVGRNGSRNFVAKDSAGIEADEFHG